MPKAITIVQSNDGYHSLALKTVPAPIPKADQVLVKIRTAALNHRDLYIRQNLYPSISFESPLLADGCGIILPSASSTKPHGSLQPGQRVLINPGTGWDTDSTTPESSFTVLGGTSTTPLGTLQEFLAIGAHDVMPAPPHVSDEEAAALPLTGLTAWRALVSKSGNAVPGRNILVTGIGGGVAIMALLFGVAMGCHVYVTSSSPEKIARARKMGAAGWVNYRDEHGWSKELKKQLPADRPYLDAVIDGAGGDIVDATWWLLKQGGVIVCYGQTTLMAPSLPMQAVMKNIEVRGSTMGSRREFREMVRFVTEKKIRPVVEKVVDGIDDLGAIDELFEQMREGKQFGKLVVRISSGQKGSRL